MFSPVQILADLVRLPSVNPMGRTDIAPELIHESRVTDYLESRLRELGADLQRVRVAPGRDNLIARYTPPTPSARTLLFEAHQDTVPVDGMTIEPFGARVEQGRLYGRGACDVKGGLTAMFSAFARLVLERPAGSANVVLACTVDEEHTFLGAQHLVGVGTMSKPGQLERSGVHADFAVVAEPTGLDIVVAHKGVARWQMETTGVAGHSSRPDRGVNAVYRMARLINAVAEYAERLASCPGEPQLGAPTISIGTVQGGISPNTIPDVCRIDVDRRLIPGETGESAIDELIRFLSARPELDFPYTIHRTLTCPPLGPPANPELLIKRKTWVDRLGTAIDSVAGRHALRAVPYGTDASTIAESGIPAVVFGPGDISQAHTHNEFIDLAELDQAVEILYRFATRE